MKIIFGIMCFLLLSCSSCNEHNKIKSTKMYMELLTQSIIQYHQKYKKLPKDLNVLVGEFLVTLEKDSWGNHYKYYHTDNDKSFELKSLGSDGEESKDDIYFDDI